MRYFDQFCSLFVYFDIVYEDVWNQRNQIRQLCGRQKAAVETERDVFVLQLQLIIEGDDLLHAERRTAERTEVDQDGFIICYLIGRKRLV